MTNPNTQNAIRSKNEKDLSFEQYKMIVDSINLLNNTREYSNPFWITVNGLTISGISYANTLADVTAANKTSLIASLVVLGYLFCLAWVNYLNTLRKSLQIRFEILRELENYYPVKVFQRAYQDLDQKEGKLSLTFNELLVPCIFLGAYTFFLMWVFVIS